jgi:hypothetical protein
MENSLLQAVLKVLALVAFFVSPIAAGFLFRYERRVADDRAKRRKIVAVNLVAALVTAGISLAQFESKQKEEAKARAEAQIREAEILGLQNEILAEQRGADESIGQMQSLLAQLNGAGVDYNSCFSNLFPVLNSLVSGLENSPYPETQRKAKDLDALIKKTEDAMSNSMPKIPPAETRTEPAPPAQSNVVVLPPPSPGGGPQVTNEPRPGPAKSNNVVIIPPGGLHFVLPPGGTNKSVPSEPQQTNSLPLPPTNFRIVPQ